MAIKRQGNSMKKRMNIVIFIMVFIGFGILIARLYQIQIVDGEMYRGKALSQQLRPTQITAKRGNIYDRNKKILASSATVWTVTISPAEIKDAAELEKIADFLERLSTSMIDNDSGGVYHEAVLPPFRGRFFIFRNRKNMFVSLKTGNTGLRRCLT